MIPRNFAKGLKPRTVIIVTKSVEVLNIICLVVTAWFLYHSGTLYFEVTTAKGDNWVNVPLMAGIPMLLAVLQTACLGTGVCSLCRKFAGLTLMGSGIFWLYMANLTWGDAISRLMLNMAEFMPYLQVTLMVLCFAASELIRDFIDLQNEK